MAHAAPGPRILHACERVEQSGQLADRIGWRQRGELGTDEQDRRMQARAWLRLGSPSASPCSDLVCPLEYEEASERVVRVLFTNIRWIPILNDIFQQPRRGVPFGPIGKLTVANMRTRVSQVDV
jgi:hypothetical protein